MPTPLITANQRKASRRLGTAEGVWSGPRMRFSGRHLLSPSPSLLLQSVRNFYVVEFQKVPKTICFPLSFNKRHIFLNIDKQSTSEHLPDTQKLFGLGVRLWSHHTSKPFLFCCVLHHLLSTYLQILQSNTLYNFKKAWRGLELSQNGRYLTSFTLQLKLHFQTL